MDPTTWNWPFGWVALALFGIVLARANATYWAGRLLRRGAERTRLRDLTNRRGYVRAVALIDRWGAPVVTASFLTVGLQTMINLAAGVTRMSLTRYLPAVAAGGVLWALLYATVGFAGFRAFTALWQRSPVLAVLVLGLAVVGFVVFIVRQARRAEEPIRETVPG